MRSKVFLYPYGPSNSARALARALGGRVLRRVNSTYRYRVGDKLINWGASRVPIRGEVVNKPEAVAVASSKLASFKQFLDAGVTTVEFTRDQATASTWGAKRRVVGRDLDRGSGGRGIRVYDVGEPIGRHVFYTKYIRKQREFRFHVYQGRVIRVLEKLKRRGHDDANKFIRSHLNGWVFASNHLTERPAPAPLYDLAIRAVAALGLDFGGVDIGWNERTGGFVLEVNTAPGLEGTTVGAYASAIKGS